MSSYRKVKNEQCSTCDGTGKLEYGKGGFHPGSPDECRSCEGYGYRVIYESDEGYQRSVTVSNHKMGIIRPYFGNYSY